MTMKRVIAALLAGYVGVFSLAFAWKPVDPIEHTLAGIVQINSLDPESGEKTYCTGFVVGTHRALTAAHCIVMPDYFTVDGELSEVVKMDGSFALVTVSSASGSKPSLKIAKKLKLQDEVLTFGYAWGDMFVFRRHVAKFHEGDWAMDGPLAPGMSGGPTVNLAGEVVGLNQAANAIIGIDCGAEELQAFLSQK